MTNIFTNKEKKPSLQELKQALGDTFPVWQTLVAYTQKAHPTAVEEWNYASAKYGWSFRMKDKKGVIVYLLPRDNFIKARFVFGQKATDIIMQSNIHHDIKNVLNKAKVYAEGRGIRIDVTNNATTGDLEKLIDIKISS